MTARERAEQIAAQFNDKPRPLDDAQLKALVPIIAAAIEEAREECAKIAEAWIEEPLGGYRKRFHSSVYLKARNDAFRFIAEKIRANERPRRVDPIR